MTENNNMVRCERETAFSWVYIFYFQVVIVLHVVGISFGELTVAGDNDNDTLRFLPVKATNLTCTSHNFWNPICWWVSGDNVNATEVLQDKHRNSEKWVTGNKTSHCEGNICCTYYPQRSYLSEFRVNTTNSYGTVVSDSLQFNAEEETVLEPPYDVRITNLSESQLKIKWHVPPGNHDGIYHFSKRLQYNIQYKWEGENNTWKEEKGTAINQFGYYTLTGLKPYGLYYVRVKAVRIHRSTPQSQYSDEAKGRTSEIAPKNPPNNFYCKADPSRNGEKRVVTLTWELRDDPFKLDGEILGVNVSIKQGSEFRWYIVEPNKTSHKILDLDPSEHYKFSIQTVNSIGASQQEDCNIDPLKVAAFSYITVLAACISTVCLIILVLCIYQRVKKSMIRFPEIEIHSQLTTDNLYSANTTSRETEIFDELIPHRLFVNLVPEDGVMTNGFDIGDKPRKTEVSEDTIKMNTFESHPLLPGFRDNRSRSEEFSFDEYGGGLESSPVSVGSGGSYLHIRNEDMAYRTMTKDGLSPVEKEATKGASGGDFDGFQELLPRPEDDGGEEGASNSLDAYTRMGALLPTQGAGGKLRGTAPQFGKRHPKESTHAVEDNAAYTSDGSVSNYTQQGFAASSASQDVAEPPYVLGTNPTDSYSQVGLRDRVNLPSPLNHQVQNQATGGLGAHDEYLRMGIIPSASDPQEVENEDNDFEDFPFILNDDILQNIPRPDSLQISPNLNDTASPFTAPSPISRDTSTGIDDLQIPSSMRTESPNEDVFLRYVAVQGDSESLDREDTEPEQEGDGYVTQGMIPNILNPRADNRNAVNTIGLPNLHSDYVDQEQLNSFPMPQAEAIPVASNHPQQAGALSPNDYVTSEQVFDIVSPGPASHSCDETFTNSNNNCEGSSDSDLSDDETKDASGFMIQGNEGVTENRPPDDPVGANSAQPTCVPPDQTPPLAPLGLPQVVTNSDFSLNEEDLSHALDLETNEEDVDENPDDHNSGRQGDTKGERQDSDGGYVTHDEMQNIARVASPT